MPEDAVYVGRPSLWGNPFKVGEAVRNTSDDPLWPYIADTVPGGTRGLVALRPLSAQQCVDLFSRWFIEQPGLMIEAFATLRGRDLACWCPVGSPCHGDWLLDMLNYSDATP